MGTQTRQLCRGYSGSGQLKIASGLQRRDQLLEQVVLVDVAVCGIDGREPQYHRPHGGNKKLNVISGQARRARCQKAQDSQQRRHYQRETLHLESLLVLASDHFTVKITLTVMLTKLLST